MTEKQNDQQNNNADQTQVFESGEKTEVMQAQDTQVMESAQSQIQDTQVLENTQSADSVSEQNTEVFQTTTAEEVKSEGAPAEKTEVYNTVPKTQININAGTPYQVDATEGESQKTYNVYSNTQQYQPIKYEVSYITTPCYGYFCLAGFMVALVLIGAAHIVLGITISHLVFTTLAAIVAISSLLVYIGLRLTSKQKEDSKKIN